MCCERNIIKWHQDNLQLYIYYSTCNPRLKGFLVSSCLFVAASMMLSFFSGIQTCQGRRPLEREARFGAGLHLSRREGKVQVHPDRDQVEGKSPEAAVLHQNPGWLGCRLWISLPSLSRTRS